LRWPSGVSRNSSMARLRPLWSAAIVSLMVLAAGCPAPVQHNPGVQGPSARASATTELRSALPENAAQSAMSEALARQGFHLRSSAHHLDGRRGSEARLRLFGALMTPDSGLPVAVLVDTEPTDGGGTKALVTVADDLGWGSRCVL